MWMREMEKEEVHEGYCNTLKRYIILFAQLPQPSCSF